MTDPDTLRRALQDLADEYDRLADRARAAHVAVLELPYIAARKALGQSLDGTPLDDDLDRALAALWKIRMAAETAGVDDDPNVFTRHVLYVAETGMPGALRRRAQEAAADG